MRPADAVHEPAREALGVAARLGVELGEHAVDGARVAADRGRHAGAHQQSQPGRPVRRQHGAGRVGEHGVRVGRAPDGHRGHPAHPHRHAARHRVPQVGLGAIEQRHRMPDAPGQRRGAGRGHEAPRAPLRIGVELRRALERAGGGRVAAAARGVVGGAGQRLGRLVVRRRGGGGAVPRAPVGVGLVVEHGGERLVRRAALGEAGGVVDGRAQQRMAEAQPRSLGGQQAGALDGVEGVGPDADALRGAQQRPDLAAVVGRREQEHPPRVVREGSTRAMKARSMRSFNGRSRRSGARPARSSSVRAPGSSSRASGLPPVTPTSSSRTTAGRALSSSAPPRRRAARRARSSGSPCASNAARRPRAPR